MTKTRGACLLLSSTVSLMISTIGPAFAAGAPADVVERGHYLANAGGCVECHTREGGKPFAGGLMIKTPFGAMSTPNITPDRATGIGAWTDDQFYRAMHEGIGHKGEYLYPVMPFPWYASVTRDDVMAIRAYLAAQPAVSQVRPPNQLSFPFNVRTSLLAWRTAFFKPETFKPDPSQSQQINRGAYLVNGLSHCGECHDSRPVAGTSKWQGHLQGGVLDNWYAPNITSDRRDGIGSWTEAQIATFLKTGAAPGKGVALGPMAQTVHSLSQLDDGDLAAIAAYLKSTPPKANASATSDANADGKRALYSGSDAVGGNAYLNYCASCHGVDGQGAAGVIPNLSGSGAVGAKGPQNVISVVLGGLQARGTYAPMLAIGAAMSDQDIADVANYVRQTWANAAPATAQAGMVAALRKEASSPMLASGADACGAIGPAPLVNAMSGSVDMQLGGITESNMPVVAEQVVGSVRRAVPRLAQADLVNGLTAAYCRVVSADATLNAAQKTLRVGHFSEMAYSAARGQLRVSR